MSDYTDHATNDVFSGSPSMQTSNSSDSDLSDLADRVNRVARGNHDTVVTVPRTEVLRNEISFRLRDTTISVRGWKACALETVSIGLMIAGGFFLVMHGPDTVRSVGSAISNSIKR